VLHYNLGFQVTFLENFELRTRSTVSHTLSLRSTATVRHVKRKIRSTPTANKEFWVARGRVEAQQDLAKRRKGKKGTTTGRPLRRADVVKPKG